MGKQQTAFSKETTSCSMTVLDDDSLTLPAGMSNGFFNLIW